MPSAPTGPFGASCEGLGRRRHLTRFDRLDLFDVAKMAVAAYEIESSAMATL